MVNYYSAIGSLLVKMCFVYQTLIWRNNFLWCLS